MGASSKSGIIRIITLIFFVAPLIYLIMTDFRLTAFIPIVMLIFTAVSMWINLLKWLPNEKSDKGIVLVSLTTANLMGILGAITLVIFISQFPNLYYLVEELGLMREIAPITYSIIAVGPMVLGYMLGPLVAEIIFDDVSQESIDEMKLPDIFIAGFFSMIMIGSTWTLIPESASHFENRWVAVLICNFLYMAIVNHFLIFRTSKVMDGTGRSKCGAMFVLFSSLFFIIGSVYILIGSVLAFLGYYTIALGLFLIILGYACLPKEKTESSSILT